MASLRLGSLLAVLLGLANWPTQAAASPCFVSDLRGTLPREPAGAGPRPALWPTLPQGNGVRARPQPHCLLSRPNPSRLGIHLPLAPVPFPDTSPPMEAPADGCGARSRFAAPVELVPLLAPPDIRRDRDGFVSLTVPHSGHPAPVALHYTTDGSDPTASSPRYTAPFAALGVTTVKAVALTHGVKPGPVARQRFDVAPLLWSLSAEPAAAPVVSGALTQVIDADPGTSLRISAQALVLDLGESLTLRGLTYTPPAQGDRGVIRSLRVSTQIGSNPWQVVSESTFDNIQNDPSPRSITWPAQEAARLKLEIVETLEPGAPAALAELEILSGPES